MFANPFFNDPRHPFLSLFRTHHAPKALAKATQSLTIGRLFTYSIIHYSTWMLSHVTLSTLPLSLDHNQMTLTSAPIISPLHRLPQEMPQPTRHLSMKKSLSTITLPEKMHLPTHMLSKTPMLKKLPYPLAQEMLQKTNVQPIFQAPPTIPPQTLEKIMEEMLPLTKNTPIHTTPLQQENNIVKDTTPFTTQSDPSVVSKELLTETTYTQDKIPPQSLKKIMEEIGLPLWYAKNTPLHTTPLQQENNIVKDTTPFTTQSDPSVVSKELRTKTTYAQDKIPPQTLEKIMEEIGLPLWYAKNTHRFLEKDLFMPLKQESIQSTCDKAQESAKINAENYFQKGVGHAFYDTFTSPFEAGRYAHHVGLALGDDTSPHFQETLLNEKINQFLGALNNEVSSKNPEIAPYAPTILYHGTHKIVNQELLSNGYDEKDDPNGQIKSFYQKTGHFICGYHYEKNRNFFEENKGI